MPPTSATRSISHWLLAFLLLLVAPLAQATFTINNDGTVTDSTTGLTWMRCAMGQTWNGTTCTGTASTYTYDQANALTGTVTFAGQSDWRLPNIRELQTIMNLSAYGPSIDSTAFPNFPNAPSNYFWSGSLYAGDSDAAWFVSFGYGGAGNFGRSNGLAVRLVRGGQSFGPLLGLTRPTSDYIDNGNGTVTHTPTNLTWKRCAEGQTWIGSTCSGTASTYTYEQAQALSGTTFAGKSDWRVPTEDELVSLVDYSIVSSGPTINSSIFPAAPNSFFWSGSLYAANSDFAWNIYFYYGYANSGYVGYRGDTNAVRLVRVGQFFATLPVCTLSANPASIYAGSSSTLSANCNPQASSYVWSGEGCVGAGSSCTVTPSSTTIYSVTGSNTGGMGNTASATVTVNQPQPQPPICTLSVNPVVIATGAGAGLVANCNPAATSYVWTHSGFDSSANGGTVYPVRPTLYSVTGVNAAGSGNTASAAVYVCNSAPSENYPGLTFSGTALADAVPNTLGADTIDGAAGVDTVVYQCNRSSFTITKTANGWKVSSVAEGIDTLTNVERIQFSNETLALDVSGNAGKAYRIYQAAFNRTPDNGGLKYWIGQMDKGMDLLEVAARFVDSDEFRRMYGTNPTNEVFMTKLYNNVLHRAPDQDGFNWWVNQLNSGTKIRTKVLADFSESPENQTNVLNAITNGIDLLN